MKLNRCGSRSQIKPVEVREIQKHSYVLKGYIIFSGKKPPRIHDLGSLLNHIIPFDKDLSEFINLCEKVSLYYIESRYPPGTLVQYEYTEIKRDLENAWEIIRKIRKKLNL